MFDLDVLFVHANASGKIYQSLNKDFSAIEPPIWASLLASGARAQGKKVAILDCEAHRLPSDESADRVLQANAKIVAIIVYGQQPSASTQNMTGASALLAELDGRVQGKTILIGLYPSALPEKTLQDEPADFVCQGEGLETLIGMLDADLENKEELKSIPGLWSRDGKTAIYGGVSEPVAQEDLEVVYPGMAWDLLPMEKYRTSNWHGFTNNNDIQPFASIYTSLGCPYHCTFCCINAPFGDAKFRYWRPEFMIEELGKLAKMGIKNIKIADEMFVLKSPHYLRLCELIIERGYDFNIWVYARIDTVKKSTLEIMKKAGINWLALGIESGVANVRKDVIKGRFDDVNIKSIIEEIQAAGISVIGNFIYGLPEDTIESMEQTLEMAIDLDLEMGNFYCCMAYPGSDLYQQAIDEGHELPDSYVGYSQHSYECLPLATKHISAKEVLNFRDKGFNRYFESERYQKKVLDTFGQETLDNINEMLKHSLKRRILGD